MNYTKMFIKPSNSSNHIANWHTYISSHDSSEEPQPQHQHMYQTNGVMLTTSIQYISKETEVIQTES